MSVCVIDIGSNTIRAVAYDDDMTPIKNSAVHAELVRFIEDGVLLPEGERRLTEALLLLKMQTEACDETFVFATSALRTVSDREGVLSLIKEETGFSAEILTEEEEAACGRAALMLTGAADPAGFDLGGGSMQIFCGEYECSLKLGSLRLYLEEKTPENAYIRAFNEIGKLPQYEQLFGMGGTIRAIGAYFKTPVIGRRELRRIMGLTPDEAAEFGERARSIGCGAAAALAVMEASGAEHTLAVNFGVREGYLMIKKRF